MFGHSMFGVFEVWYFDVRSKTRIYILSIYISTKHLAIHALQYIQHLMINISTRSLVVGAKKMLRSPLPLSLKKASSLNWGDLNFFLFNCHSKKMVRPLLLLRGGNRIYTLSIDFLRDVGNGVSPFLRVARTTHMH